MKKVKYLLLLLMVTFTMTGCVKYNTTMDIKKDKSMNFSVIFAIDKTMFGDSTKALDDKQLSELKKAGYEVSDYNKDNMVGFRIEKKIKNIDDISTDGKSELNLSKLLNEDGEFGKIFTVKKGLFKNTYKASFSFNPSDSNLNSSVSDATSKVNDNTLAYADSTIALEDDEYNEDNIEEDEVYGDEDEDTNSLDSSFDFSSSSNMDLSFNVNLPYAAKNSNTTSKDNDGKTLKWELNAMNKSSIEFEFEMYNMTNIYIAIGASIALVAIAAFIIIKKKNAGAKTENIEVQPTLENN